MEAKTENCKAEKKTTGLALAPAIDPHNHSTKKKKITGLALAPGIEPDGRTEIVDPVTKNYLATRLDEQEEEGELLKNDSDSIVFPGAVRIGGSADDDCTYAPDQAESLDLRMSTPAASAADLLLQANLAPADRRNGDEQGDYDNNDGDVEANYDESGLLVEAEIAPDVNAEVARALRDAEDKRREEIAEAVVYESPKVCGIPRRWAITTAVLLIVGGVAAALGNALSSSETDTSSDPPTNMPSYRPSQSPTISYSPSQAPTINRFEAIINTLRAANVSFPLLQNKTTPQFMALDWLANEDSARLPLESTSGYVFRERYAMAVLYYSVLEEEQTRVSLLEILQAYLTNAKSICEWYGVECHEDRSVSSINWNFGWIVSRIPTEVGLLSNMTALDVSQNNLYGTIPSELGSLQSLTYLDLGVNFLTGTIPSELGSLQSLTFLDLGATLLTGNLDPIFCTGSRRGVFNEFRSDCQLNEIQCSCCTICCAFDGSEEACYYNN